MKTPGSAALLLALALLPAAARAARPLATDDAGVLASGDCEWETVALRLKAAPGNHGWNTLGTCGVGGGLQLAAAYGQERAAGVASHKLFAGAKQALVDGGEAGTSFTLTAGIDVLRARGSGDQRDNLLLNLVATRVLSAGLTGHANLGWLHSRPAHSAATTWNLALEHAGPARIDLTGEVYGDDRSRAPWLGVGARWAATPRFGVNAGWARQGGAGSARLATLGVKLAF